MCIQRKPCFKNLIKNLPFIISGGAYALFYATSLLYVVSWPNVFLSVLMFAAILIVSLHLTGVFSFWKSVLSLKNIAATIGVQAVTVYFFFSKMFSITSSSKLQSLSSAIGISPKALVVLGVLALVAVSFYFCCTVVGYVISDVKENTVYYTGFSDHSILATEKNIICRFFTYFLRLLLCLCLVGLVICSLNSYIWVDEAFTLGLIKYNFIDVIKLTASDVHPPLYYLLLKIIEDALSMFSASLSFRIIVAKLFSVAAYALTAILCWRKFSNVNVRGYRELLLLCLFATPLILSYSTEIRMYGWGMFFVTGTYLYARDILDNPSTMRAWPFLTVFSLCSAYTHNYALISMAAVWLYLLIWMIRNHRDLLKKWFLYGLITAIGYCPWLLVLLRQTTAVSEDYWISNLSMTTFVSYLINIFPASVVIIPVIVFYILLRKSNRSNLSYILTGAFVTFATLAIGVIASILIRPVFVIRYIIPSALCLWITVFLSWCKMRERQKLLIAVILVCSCILSECTFITGEYTNGRKADDVLELVKSMEPDSVVCVEDTVGSHGVRVVATYISDTVYFVSDQSLSDLTQNAESFDALSQKVYPNLQAANQNIITDAIEEGRTVYYISTNESIDSSQWDEAAACDLLGEYTFEVVCFVYKISPDTQGVNKK